MLTPDSGNHRDVYLEIKARDDDTGVFEQIVYRILKFSPEPYQERVKCLRFWRCYKMFIYSRLGNDLGDGSAEARWRGKFLFIIAKL